MTTPFILVIIYGFGIDQIGYWYTSPPFPALIDWLVYFRIGEFDRSNDLGHLRGYSLLSGLSWSIVSLLLSWVSSSLSLSSSVVSSVSVLVVSASVVVISSSAIVSSVLSSVAVIESSVSAVLSWSLVRAVVSVEGLWSESLDLLKSGSDDSLSWGAVSNGLQILLGSIEGKYDSESGVESGLGDFVQSLFLWLEDDGLLDGLDGLDSV